MKFMDNIELRLGFRFYTMIEYDEYEIFSVIYINEGKQIVTLFNEETYDVKEIDLKDLNIYYTLLTEYDLIPPVSITRLLNKESIKSISIVFYRFISKKVLYKIIELVCKYNHIPIYKKDIDSLWDLYINSIYNTFNKFYIFEEESVTDIYKAVDDKDYKLSDIVFLDVEDSLHTVITSYDVYAYNDSINIYNIKRDFFILYSIIEDKYFLFLYNKDDSLYSECDDNIKDLVNFMNGR